jgi:hypothetical protein
MAALRAHYVEMAQKDRACAPHRPSKAGICACAACACLMLAWGIWVLHLGWHAWHSGQTAYRTSTVYWAELPARYALAIVGLVVLGAYSLDAAVQYGVKAWDRLIRRKQKAV